MLRSFGVIADSDQHAGVARAPSRRSRPWRAPVQVIGRLSASRASRRGRPPCALTHRGTSMLSSMSLAARRSHRARRPAMCGAPSTSAAAADQPSRALTRWLLESSPPPTSSRYARELRTDAPLVAAVRRREMAPRTGSGRAAPRQAIEARGHSVGLIATLAGSAPAPAHRRPSAASPAAPASRSARLGCTSRHRPRSLHPGCGGRR